MAPKPVRRAQEVVRQSQDAKPPGLAEHTPPPHHPAQLPSRTITVLPLSHLH